VRDSSPQDSRPPETNRPAVARPHRSPPPARPGVLRRTAFLAGLGALTLGTAIGAGLGRLGLGSSTDKDEIVGPGRGRWVHVASVTEIPSGAIRPFTAGALQGFVINEEGRYRALSRLCTHMGCALAFHQRQQAFICPCHGAAFAVNGRQRFGSNYYRSALPPLPEIDVRTQGDSVQVLAA
jgi:nitrite reductase/ring-hydroxylating ferredoxin subunit